MTHGSAGPRDLFDARPQEDADRDIMADADQDKGAGPLALDSLVCLEDFNSYMSKVRHTKMCMLPASAVSPQHFLASSRLFCDAREMSFVAWADQS